MRATADRKILIVEDEPDVVDLLTRTFNRSNGFSVIAAADGATGLRKAREEAPAFIVLDLMIPKMSGVEVCKILKNDTLTSHIPIMMLTAKAEEIDRILGLELGADDYVTKPFSPREVALRVQAILRRGETPAAEKSIVVGAIKVDSVRHSVTVNEKPVYVTSIEFKLLRTLMERRGRVQERDRLLSDVWGYETAIDTRTVDTHVRRLREKLGKAGDLIETVRGFGYRMRDA